MIEPAVLDQIASYQFKSPGIHLAVGLAADGRADGLVPFMALFQMITPDNWSNLFATDAPRCGSPS